MSALTPNQIAQVRVIVDPIIEAVTDLEARVKALERQMPPALTGAQRRGFLDLLDTLREQLEPE